MSDSISKDVLIKIDTKIGSGDGLKKTSSDARTAANDVARLDKAMAGASKEAKGFTSSGRDAFRGMTDGAGKARDAVGKLTDGLRNANKEASKLKGGFGGQLERGTIGRHGIGGALGHQAGGALMGAAGGLAGMALGGGGLAAGAGIGQQLFETWVDRMGGAKDARQANLKQDETLNKHEIASALTEKLRAAEMERHDSLRTLLQPTVASQTFQPFRRVQATETLSAKMRNLSAEQEDISGRIAGRTGKMAGMGTQMDKATADRERFMKRQRELVPEGSPEWAKAGANTMLAGFGANIRTDTFSNKARDADTERLKIGRELLNISKEQVKDAERVKDLAMQRAQLSKELADVTREGIKEKRTQFAEMDPMQQLRAIDLGTRMKKREKLEGADLEEAQNMPVLRDLVQQQKLEDPDMNRNFVQFLKNVGNADERKAAARAEVAGDVNVEMHLDVEALADAIAKRVGNELREVKAKLANVEAKAQQARNDQDGRAAQERVNGGP